MKNKTNLENNEYIIDLEEKLELLFDEWKELHEKHLEYEIWLDRKNMVCDKITRLQNKIKELKNEK